MSYERRKPPIKLMVDIDTFNSMNEFLTIIVNKGDEAYTEKASRMKDKLLRYSVPRTDENGETTIDIRFFINEASDLLTMFVNNLNKEQTENNYYETLIDNRKIKREE